MTALAGHARYGVEALCTFGLLGASGSSSHGFRIATYFSRVEIIRIQRKIKRGEKKRTSASATETGETVIDEGVRLTLRPFSLQKKYVPPMPSAVFSGS